MVALRLMRALLHCHVSKDNKPRAATSSIGLRRLAVLEAGPLPLGQIVGAHAWGQGYWPIQRWLHEQRFRPQTRWGEGLSLQFLLVTG